MAIRPPAAVLDHLEALPRPDISGIRWTGREQWHVTLRFLGDVEDPDAALRPLRQAFATVAPAEAVAGPAVGRLGGGVAMLPVSGLGSMATAAVEATGHIGKPPPARPFVGHLTLARLEQPGRRCPLVGAEIAARWTVTEIELIRSHLSPNGSHYETLAAIATNR